MLRSNLGITLIISLLFLIGIISWLVSPNNGLYRPINAKEHKVVYTNTYENLTLKVFEWKTTADPDTGQVIIKMPVEIKNKSDHAFIIRMPHFSYNGDESVFTLFNVKDEGINGKISRLESKEGTISITLETREPSDVKTLNPTLTIYDMKSEKEIELHPELKKP
jgi:hypothetical protein